MTVIAFDTLTYANKLKQAGLNGKIAEVQAQITAELLQDLTNKTVVTKEDLQNELRSFELRIYSILAKFAVFIVGSLGGLQALFHYLK